MRFLDYLANEPVKESILDRPRSGLDPDVWTKNSEGEYVPTTYASQKIDEVVQWAVTEFGITDPVVHITGSIASNSFGDASDIDIHFCSDTFEPDDPDEFNKKFRAAFAENFGPETGSETGFIGVHPVEVYFQTNPFQDMMSVGCYDYLGRKWESGPEIKDTVFDPYSEYYEKDMKYVDSLISDIRNTVLGVFEKALVLKKATDGGFRKALSAKFAKGLKDAAELFDSIRGKRKVMSSPKSKEDALRMRTDRKWHIADSAFKLMDKFGYLAILKTYKQLSETGVIPPSAADDVIASVRENIYDNKMLTDDEKTAFLDETEISGMPGWDESDLKADISGWLEGRIGEYGLDIEILDISLHGSRTRKDFRRDSDLDVMVYYRGTDPDGKNAKEDHVWNMLNDEPKCEIDGVPVDFWPVRDGESGPMSDVLRMNAAHDAAVRGGARIWVDDIRPAPAGYTPFTSVDQFIDWYISNGKNAYAKIAVLDLDHDAGDFRKNGGDYIRILDFLEKQDVPELTVRLHSANPVGTANMRRVVDRNGWTEITGVVNEDGLNEGVGSALRNAAFAGMMALAPGMAQAGRQPDRPVAAQKAEVKKMIGKLSEKNLVNLLATIAYNETMLDWLKYRDDDEIIAVLKTVDERAAGDRTKYPAEISRGGQYFSRKHVKGGYDEPSYRTYDPNQEAKDGGGAISGSQKECWRLCQQYAKALVDGNLKFGDPELEAKFGDRNMIGNPAKDTDASATKDGGWLERCDIRIGGQVFGYDSAQDGYRRYGRKKPAGMARAADAARKPVQYVVKSGDNLWKIAKANNTTVQKIKDMNGLGTDTIRPGQKLRV